MIDARIFVQARMSSHRLPGKMLAPLAGRPLITHVLSRVADAVPPGRVVLVTSEHPTDDPLALFVRDALGVQVFRGALDDVVDRFQACARQHPCEWFVRISGDSPAIEPELIRWMLDRVSPELDLLTNVQRRTFPPGQSVEVVRTQAFLPWPSARLSSEEREHLTQHFYRHPERFKIRNVSMTPGAPAPRMVVDTHEDLIAMEALLASPPWSFAGAAHLDEVTA